MSTVPIVVWVQSASLFSMFPPKVFPSVFAAGRRAKSICCSSHVAGRLVRKGAPGRRAHDLLERLYCAVRLAGTLLEGLASYV